MYGILRVPARFFVQSLFVNFSYEYRNSGLRQTFFSVFFFRKFRGFCLENRIQLFFFRVFARRAYCVERSKNPCVCVRPSVRARSKNGPVLVTKNRVFTMVTPSSATNFGSERDVFRYLVTKSGCLMDYPNFGASHKKPFGPPCPAGVI